MNRGIYRVIAPWVCWVATAGCQHSNAASSPRRLVQAHRAALQADDPHAAYALLSPQVRAKTPYDAFEARWKDDAKERKRTLAAELPSTLPEPVYEGVTVHDGGHVLHWTQVDGRYRVTAGLPGRPQATTPAQAIRGLVTAVRRADLSEIQALLTDDLGASLEEDWQARVTAIEAALGEPGVLVLSDDRQRASLRYGTDQTLTLQQTPQGWRVVALQ